MSKVCDSACVKELFDSDYNLLSLKWKFTELIICYWLWFEISIIIIIIIINNDKCDWCTQHSFIHLICTRYIR